MTTPRLPTRRPRGNLGLGVLVGLAILVLFLPTLIRLAAEWPWFNSLGYGRVFTTRLVAGGLLGLVVGGVAFAFLYANLRFAQRGVVPNPLIIRLNPDAPVLDVTRLIGRLALPAALGLALLFAIGGAGGWLRVLQFLHRTPFGVTDPVFGRDVSYYVFTVPVLAGALGILTALTMLALIAVVALYVLRRDVVVFQRNVTVEPSARIHLAGLIALLFLLAALRVYFLRIPALLQSTTGPLVGASFADLHATLIGLRLAGLAALAGAALVLWGATSKRLARHTAIAVAIYFGVSLLGVTVYPAVVQRLGGGADGGTKEKPPLAPHME